MGLSYTNITTYGTTQNDLVWYLSGLRRDAYVSPTVRKATVVYDRKSEDQGPDLGKLAHDISVRFECVALATLLHDGGVFWYQLWNAGQVINEYNSNPGYFTGAVTVMPEGGNAERLSSAFGALDAIKDVDNILKLPNYGANKPSEARRIAPDDRHQELIQALGLPPFAAGFGFDSIKIGQLPQGISKTALMRTAINVGHSPDSEPPKQLQLF